MPTLQVLAKKEEFTFFFFDKLMTPKPVLTATRMIVMKKPPVPTATQAISEDTVT